MINPFNNKQKKLSLDMGSSAIKCAIGHSADNGIVVERLFSFPIDAGLYDNGNILDADRLEQAIKQQLDLHRVKHKQTVVVTESTEILKRDIIVPQVDDADMADLIQYEVAQYLPIDVDDYIIQHRQLANIVEDDKPKRLVTIAAMPKRLAKSHFDLMTSCGLKPVKLDLSGNSVARFFNHCNRQDANRVNAFIDIGKGKTEINIIERDSIKLNRVLRYGLGAITSVLHSHGITDKHTILTIEDALYNNGLEQLDISLLEANVDNGAAVGGDLRELFNDIGSEIEKVFKFYLSRKLDNRIDQVILYGGAATIKHMHEFLSQSYAIPTSLYAVHDTATIRFKENSANLTDYVVAIGGLI